MPQTAPSSGLAPGGQQPLMGQRILLVEDESLIALKLMKVFKDEGADMVGVAATPSNALRFLHEYEVDAAVLDIGLREGEVYPVADALSEAGIPFVFYSGRFQNGPSVRFYKGAPCIDKGQPDAERTLLGKLRLMLGMRPMPNAPTSTKFH